MEYKTLQPSFYTRSALDVAPALLGKRLIHREVVLRIVETEAYCEADTASHAYRGKTPRNEPMFGAGGYAYVYLCYGIHHLFNVVVGPLGVPSAVLIRGAVVISGQEIVKERRSGKLDLIGPGKVGQALNVTVADSGRGLFSQLRIEDGPKPSHIEHRKRVGIDYAEPVDRDALWRFVAMD